MIFTPGVNTDKKLTSEQVYDTNASSLFEFSAPQNALIKATRWALQAVNNKYRIIVVLHAETCNFKLTELEMYL